MNVAPILAIGAVLGASAYAQPSLVSASASVSGGAASYSQTFDAHERHVIAIPGAPYSAEQLSEHTRTLADGTHIVDPHRPRVMMYRDSQGRTRFERQIPGVSESGVPKIIEIADPVAGYSYILDETNKVAHRVKLEVMAARRTPPEAPSVRTTAPPLSNPARPENTTESLGTQIIEGLQAEGMRTTTTWPVNSFGNDRPIMSTHEIWRAADLHLVVLSKSNDPRSGESITKLMNISRAEPDPSLFQPPPDYSVVDEEGEFTVKITQPAK